MNPELLTIVNLYLTSVMCDVSGTCRLGTHGQNCEKNCSLYCATDVDENVHCERSSGRCSEGCVPGWHGHQCIRPCSSNCNNRTCNQQTGDCTLGCIENYNGDKCERVTVRRNEEEEKANQTLSSGITPNTSDIIPAVVALTIVAVIIISAVMAWNKYFRRHPQVTNQEQMSLNNVEDGRNDGTVSPDQSNEAPTPRREEVHVNNDLHDAVHRGNLRRVKHILSEDNVDIDSIGKEGRTAVMLAASWGHSDIFNAVMSEKPDVSKLDQNGNNILHLACLGGDTEIVNYILSQKMADINSRNQDGRTPVMWAASCGHKDLFFSLLYKHHAGISVEDTAGKNILHWACCGGNIEIVKHVLSLKIFSIDSGDNDGMTPAMVAAEKGRKNVLDFLIYRGADLSLKDSFSNDAYQLAALSGHGDMLEEESTNGHTRRPCFVM